MRHGVVERLRQTARCLVEATSVIADIVILAAAAALVVGVLNLTGLAFALTLQLLQLSGGVPAILLLLMAWSLGEARAYLGGATLRG